MNRTVCTGLIALLVSCVGRPPADDGGGGADGGSGGEADGGGAGAADAGDGVAERCVTPVAIPVDAPERAVDLLARDALVEVAARVPCVTEPGLRGVLESGRTMWYDHASIVPGYQDSFGDNVVAPIGMRPNTIRSSLIDTAVPGGHAQIFAERGRFHFPFGAPTGASEADLRVVDFWQLPADRPVVWWKREPNQYTHRINWLFPVGTVFGELLFIRAGGELWPFEIRTRVRAADGWQSTAYRPFATAAELADALEAKRGERPAWAADGDIDALVAHLRDPSTLEPATLGSTHFASAFPEQSGAIDSLPALADPSILEALLMERPFRSVDGAVWKAAGGLEAYAPTTAAGLSVVPPGYNGGLVAVDADSCDRCHRDAGRPFKDWYDNILAYGELWGEDEIFSWHPFANDTFVDASGDVVDFNYDNRSFRTEFVDRGLLVPYDSDQHPDTVYKTIPRSWKGYAY